MAKKQIYKVLFINQGKLYEVYADQVGQGELYGFVELEGLNFGENTTLVVDPAEERLKSEFAGVEKTFIPMHAVVRIDQVNKQGPGKIVAIAEKGENVTPFPSPIYVPERGPEREPPGGGGSGES